LPYGNEPRIPTEHDAELASYLERHIELAGDCWEWQRCLDNFGYGLTRWQGVVRRAHRLSWYAKHGYFTPRGIVLRHTCDNPRCCNPSHLVEGTRADNNRDRDRRGRQVAPTGESHGCAKLTTEQVLEIRASKGAARLARKFGVSESTIYAARCGRTWGHAGASA
jgi:hypothetical protein